MAFHGILVKTFHKRVFRALPIIDQSVPKAGFQGYNKPELSIFI